MLLGNNHATYLRVAFSNEAEIEDIILDNIGLLFGDYSLLLAKSKLKTIGGTGSIPDGVLINFESKEWYIIEVERGVHKTWEHIAPQVSKQLTAILNAESKAKILTQAIQSIGTDKDFLDLLQEVGIKPLNIHGELQSIIDKPPILALPIDEIPDDLEEWASTLKIEFKIWTVEKYISSSNDVIYSIPEFNQARGSSTGVSAASPDTQPRQGSLMRRVVDGGFLKEGAIVHMDYGPKGKPKKHFQGHIRPDGIELDDKVYSPSIAALRCIQTVSPSRTSANGWTKWKTADGTLIDDAYKKYLANLDENDHDAI